jgi:hypothetical protein
MIDTSLLPRSAKSIQGVRAVLIRDETGTGKELAALAIQKHRLGRMPVCDRQLRDPAAQPNPV